VTVDHQWDQQFRSFQISNVLIREKSLNILTTQCTIHMVIIFLREISTSIISATKVWRRRDLIVYSNDRSTIQRRSDKKRCLVLNVMDQTCQKNDYWKEFGVRQTGSTGNKPRDRIG
jgi:hypothetical protein